jgi:AraC-like DNA-binding protein
VQATSFVNSYIDAWNHSDPVGVADHLAADGVYRDIPLNRQRSHDELIESLSDFFAKDRYKYELIGNVLAGKNSIAFQYRMSSLDKAGNRGDAGFYCGAEFLTLVGDSALIITDYYDIPETARADGVAGVAVRHSLTHKYAKSGLNAEQLEKIKRRLEYLMNTEKAFLRSDLTLPKLAAAADCSVNHLSQVINSGFGVSFFDYLNQHRIEYATNLLGDFAGHNNAILNIAFAVGFNSNSAFYAAFKKSIGQTPAQFRRSQSKTAS